MAREPLDGEAQVGQVGEAGDRAKGREPRGEEVGAACWALRATDFLPGENKYLPNMVVH